MCRSISFASQFIQTLGVLPARRGSLFAIRWSPSQKVAHLHHGLLCLCAAIKPSLAMIIAHADAAF